MNISIHRALTMSIVVLTASATHLYGASTDTHSINWEYTNEPAHNPAVTSTIELIEADEIVSTPRVLVETILFRNNKQPESSEITWLARNDARPPETALELNLSPLIRSYQRSDELLQTAQKISGNNHYTMINTQAWLQPIAKNDQAPPVRIKLKWQNYDIDGLFTVYKSRSLHVMSDVSITRTPDTQASASDQNINTELVLVPATLPTSDDSGLADYNPQTDIETPDNVLSSPGMVYAPVTARLTETRRVRHNQWNFFDHPNFGLLLKVSTFND